MDIEKIVKIMEKERKVSEPTAVESFIDINKSRNPFKVLISTIISLRTKDEVTALSSKALFKLADTPSSMSKMTIKKIEKAIYPCGFFRNKAKTIREISKEIVKEYAGEVPDSIEELVKFKGVGRKTANLVLTLGFDKPAICVDIHVHRIFNRLGYVKTKNPDETEMKLRDKLPLKLWKRINSLLVFYGQKICRPVSPFCTDCKLTKLCKKNNVLSYR